jgi:hypothetical protein
MTSFDAGVSQSWVSRGALRRYLIECAHGWRGGEWLAFLSEIVSC